MRPLKPHPDFWLTAIPTAIITIFEATVFGDNLLFSNGKLIQSLSSGNWQPSGGKRCPLHITPIAVALPLCQVWWERAAWTYKATPWRSPDVVSEGPVMALLGNDGEAGIWRGPRIHLALLAGEEKFWQQNEANANVSWKEEAWRMQRAEKILEATVRKKGLDPTASHRSS